MTYFRKKKENKSTDPETWVPFILRKIQRLSKQNPRWKCRYTNSDKEVIYKTDAWDRNS